MSPPSQLAKAVAQATSGFQRLPYEIMSYIVQDLKLEEVFDLSLSSRHFQYLVRDENLCKLLLKAKAPYSFEAEEAQQNGRYARALRILVKRRRAIALASPYVAGIVGFADSYVFHCGKLCYIHEDRPQRWLRILDVQKATNDEIVIDIPVLIAQAVSGSETLRKYTFKVLHHADDITSCLFSFAKPTTKNWLLIFNASEHRLLGKILLESAIRIFVRNNRNHLYFGTHSGYDEDGFRKWVLRYFNLQECLLSREKMHLSDVVGYEIGTTVCFEVIDDYFYGCSNQTEFEIEEIDWTSYYYCFRFPLGRFGRENTQIMRKRDSWRRQHAEGPIDDRWGFLKLEKDEVDSSIRIIECRKEWLTGRSGNRRTYYNKPVKFPIPDEDDGSGEDDGSLDSPPQDDPLTGLLSSSSKPNYMEAPPRPLLEFHPGDDGSVMFTRSSTYLCSYHHSCETFLDLVNDPLSSDPSTQRLRLRSGRRVFDIPPEAEPFASPTAINGQRIAYSIDTDVTQRNVISVWPSGPGPPTRPNQYFKNVDWIMNPPDHTGNITATGDERSIIYATNNEGTGGLKALVYLSFDPSVKLAGMIRGGCLEGQAVESADQREVENDAVDRKGKGKVSYCTAQQLQVEDTSREKGVGIASSSSPSLVQTSTTEDLPKRTLPTPEDGIAWATVSRAFHQELPLWKIFFGGSGQGLERATP